MFGKKPKQERPRLRAKPKAKEGNDAIHTAVRPPPIPQRPSSSNTKAWSTTNLTGSRPVKSSPLPNGGRPTPIYSSYPAAATTTAIPTASNALVHYSSAPGIPYTVPYVGGPSLNLAPPAFPNHQGDAFSGATSNDIFSKLNSVITAIDEENFTGEEKDLVLHNEPTTTLRGGGNLFSRKTSASATADRAISSTLITSNVFTKATLYANSHFPAHLPPLQLYLPAFPLICLSASYSQRAYTTPSPHERNAFVPADWRLGTKAMVIKSVAFDDRNTIVFAIRGSQTFMDWAVNLHTNPEAPEGFLDDPGNLCHSGFLSVARKMVKAVAARLRSLLQENPNRSTCSLLMTGHSAGGAVATLLYAHMLAETEAARSELNILTGCFRRIHCITFGTPPISLLPLQKPSGERYKKNLFLSFINEGDPVPRADPAYIRSLLHLYASPAPGGSGAGGGAGRGGIALPDVGLPCQRKKAQRVPLTSQDFVWEVPPGTLSNAGRLVGLKGEPGPRVAAGKEEDVKGVVARDYDLRGVVFGDPVMHMMSVYARRVEVLATKAVTGGVWHGG